jgi:signal transduction histidine kinase
MQMESNLPPIRANPQAEDQSPHILVIDDHEGIRRLLSIILQRSGYEVITCEDGPDALAHLRTVSVDLVLLDLALPIMTGYEVLSVIRDNPDTADLPVIILTANGETEEIVRGLQSGANDYVTKPFEESVLLARVDTHRRLKRLIDQRRQDVERLKMLDSLKDRFVTIASHDLKGPLGTITSGIELMRDMIDDDTVDTESLQSVLDSMTASSATMTSIITDFLDLQAIRAGGLELNLRPLHINGLIDLTVDQFRYDAVRKDIQIETALNDDMPEMLGDAERLTQVLGNLVSNALKYSPQGSTVWIRSSRVDNKVRVEVQDQGPGIAEEDKPHLFQEFFRLRNRPTGGEASSGVGLSIIRDLVEMHSGKIGVESTLGQGSTFWIELPSEQPEAV